MINYFKKISKISKNYCSYSLFLIFFLYSCSNDSITSPDNLNPIEVMNGTWDITTTKSGSKRIAFTASSSEINDGEWVYSGSWTGNTFRGSYKNPPYDAFMSIKIESKTKLSGYMSLKVTVPGASKSNSDDFTGSKVK